MCVDIVNCSEMFLRKTGNLLNLINKQTANRLSSYVRANELNPFDYDRIPSDFDDKLYKEMLDQDDAFDIKKMVDLKELFDNRCHLGHKTGTLNEFMKPYLIGHRQEITIFDLNQTVEHLKKALNFAAHMAFRDSIILFVNPSRETAHIIEKAAIECGEYSQCRQYEEESLLKSEMYYGTPVRLPDLVIVFKTMCNNFTQHEIINSAAKNLTPTIGIVDSNCDPRLITYPIPANDDTECSIRLYARLFRDAINAGKAKRNELIETTRKS